MKDPVLTRVFFLEVMADVGSAIIQSFLHQGTQHQHQTNN